MDAVACPNNSVCSPVSRLPTEILCKIFIYARIAQESSGQPWRRKAKWDITWIRLSQVSRRWRMTALNEPNLWTNPPLWNPTWTQIMLSRSQMAGLPAIILDPPNMKADVIASVLQHITRIADFTICRTDSNNLQRILATLPSAAPALESLSVNCERRFSQNHDIVLPMLSYFAGGSFVDVIHASGSVLSQAPKLRKLELSGVVLNWNQALCSSVQSFTLSEISFDLLPRLNLRSILELMPNLTSLQLYNACPSSSLQQYTQAPLHLMHLESIVVRPSILQAIYLLEMLAIHSTTRVHVDTSHEDILANQTHLRRLLAAMKGTFPPVVASDRATHYERLSINDRYLDGIMTFGISKVSTMDRNLFDVKSETLLLTVAGLYADHDWADIVDHFQNFDACLLSEIGLNIGPEEYRIWDIVKFMTPLSGIRRVVLTCSSTTDFTNALLSYTNRTENLILPALEHIRVVHSDYDPHPDIFECLDAIDALQKLAMEQRDRGAPLKSLRISGCFKLEKSHVLPLKDIVEYVVWDEAGVDPDFPDYRPYDHI